MSFRLYPRRSEPALDPELFRNPPSAYRGTPFWCWNDRLDRTQLLRQLDVIQKMGFGGFHIHSRTGLATEYLGPTWLNLVRMCTDEAERRQMLCWLYDEDRWPSGYAGGLATSDIEFRQRHLLWTSLPYGQDAPRGKSDYTTAVRNETGRLLARYEIELDADFRLARYRRLSDREPTPDDRVIWHAYIEPATPSTWFNGQTAVDAFSRRAIERFIETTHERYREAVGDRFGAVIPAFFTDEPQFVKKSMFTRGDEQHDLFMPISEDFCDTFRAAFGIDLLDHLPELFWNLQGDAPSLARYRYHEHTADRFATAFSDTLGDWCERHGVALTGHMLGEGSLMSQTRGCGEAMRGLRAFQLPGVDMLCDKRELTTVLQARSVAHQMGREGVVSELYGVTGWHFDFVGHKAQGDWQAALGVTVRVPHLFWMSMRGEAKRDYPASIGEQSPWFEEYTLIEDHFARVATVMTRGKPAIRVAMIHPIESAWLAWGPKAHNDQAAARLERAFTQLPEWLLLGGIDFDFVSERHLAQCADQTGDRLRIGQMEYDCVVIPQLTTIRSTTLDALTRFTSAGGTVICIGEAPPLVDAKPSPALQTRWPVVAMDRGALLDALARFHDVRITHASGERSNSILHRLRVDGDARQLLLVNTDREQSRHLRIELDGHWDVTCLDTFSGDSAALARTLRAGVTSFEYDITAHGHLLVTLTPATPRQASPIGTQTWTVTHTLPDPVPITLSEPNVLLLDHARWSNGPTPDERVEILRLDNAIRHALYLPPRNGRGVQPWADREHAPVLRQIELVFGFESDIDLTSIELAIENPEQMTIHLDDALLSNVPIGWWVDQALSRVALPSVRAGRHTLRLSVPFTRKTELEAIYLLGDFGVSVDGSRARITTPPRTLTWGDWTTQGLPFYGGNVVYHTTLPARSGRSRLCVPSFANPLLAVDHAGQRLGTIAFSPFELELDPDVRQIDVTAFGNRANTFGPLHHADEHLRWIGPPAWRTTGDKWSDAYKLKQAGILEAPQVLE